MEKISKNDALFLLALNASEESSINCLKSDFEYRDSSEVNMPQLLEGLLKEGLIRFALLGTDITTDYSLAESLELVANINEINSHLVFLYLTDSGFDRWESDGWGVTPERASYLMFGNGD